MDGLHHNSIAAYLKQKNQSVLDLVWLWPQDDLVILYLWINNKIVDKKNKKKRVFFTVFGQKK